MALQISKYSLGIGDRFAHEGEAQLAAFVAAKKMGIEVAPVWNKSNREHMLIGTQPASVKAEAEAAVKALGWTLPFHVDADHIGLKTVDNFIAHSDFFTIDVADFIGQPASPESVEAFVKKYRSMVGTLNIPGIAEPITVTEDRIRGIAQKFLLAVQDAGKIYRHIEAAKGKGNFIPEVSMDETDTPQKPVDMLFILAALADEGVPLQTVAPKFSGRFNKGVDYVGDVAQFEKEFNDDLAVVAFAIKRFGLPANLKLSVHSGSDKFSIYPAINRAIKRTGAGLHVKTAGTNWLEEVIGLAEAGGDGLAIANEIYSSCFNRIDELTKPYATVIDVNRAALPKPEVVKLWSGSKFAATLRHDQKCADFNPSFRQLVHVSFKAAAEAGTKFTDQLKKNRAIIAKGVTDNLLTKHILPIFG